MIRKLIRHPNPLLIAQSDAVDLKSDQDLLTDLLDTFADYHGTALGLAAVQIGRLKRAAVVVLHGKPALIVNPFLKWRSSIYVSAEEGCLSIPWIKLKVSRANAVKLAYVNRDGTAIVCTLHGPDARVVQHELDHMDGITLDQHRRKKA